MATVEELLVRLGVDPTSVNKFLTDVESVKTQAEKGSVNISVRSNAGRELASVSTAVGSLTVKTQAFTQGFQQGFQRLEQGANRLRGTLLAVGAAAGLSLAGGIALAVEESNNLAAANVILRFNSVELAQAQDDLRKVADDVGLTFQTVSAALFDVASAGFQGEEAITVTTAAARVAVPANTDVATAFSAIATAMTNFGFAADEAGDKLVRTADLSRATLGEIADSLGILGPVAGQFGISFDEVAGSLALLTNRGISANRATTSLNAVITSILKPSGDAEKAFRKLGITTGDNAFQQQTLLQILQRVNVAIGEGTAGVTDFFENVEALRAAAALVGATEELSENIIEVGNSAGRTQQALEDFLSAPGPQVQRLGAAFTNLLTIIGEDFLRALLPVIRFLSDFIVQNRNLLATLGELFIVGVSVIGVFIGLAVAIRTLSAINDIVIGSLQILRTAFALVTTATKANTTAIALNTGAREASIVSAVVNFLSRVRVFLNLETGTVINNTRAWILNTASRAGGLVLRFLSFLKATIVFIVAETVAIIANTIALRFNTAARQGATLELVKFNRIGSAGVRSLRLFTVGLGVASAALIGFEAGRAINQILGLSDAVGRFVKGTERGLDRARVAFVRSTNPVADIIIGLNAMEAAAERANQALLTTAAREELEKDIVLRKEFTRILEENAELDEATAFQIAANIQAQIAFLQRLEKQNRITNKQQFELSVLTNQLSEAMSGATSEVVLLERASKDLGFTREKLKEIEKELVKIIAKVAKDTIRIRRGAEDAQLVTVRQGAEKRLEILRKAGGLLVAETRLIEEGIIREREKGDDANAVIIRAGEQKLRVSQRRLAEVNRTIVDDFNNTTNEIIQIGAKRVQAIRQQGQQEIASVRKTADAVINEERRKVTEATRELRKLTDERKRGIEAGERFIDRLTQRAIARVDPALAQLRRLEQEAIEGLRGVTAQQAQRAIGLLVKEIELLTEPTREEVQLLKDLDRIRKQATGAGTEKELLSIFEEERRIQAELIALREKRELRAIAAQRVEERIEKFAASAADRREDDAINIQTQLDKIAQGNLRIAQIERLRLEQEAKIGDVIEANVKRQQTFVKVQLETLRIATQLARALSAPGVSPVEAARLKTALDLATTRVQRLQRETTQSLEAARRAVGLARAQAQSAFDAIAADFKEQQETAKATEEAAGKIETQVDQLTRVTEIAGAAQQRFSTSVDELLSEQIRFGQTVTDFAATTDTKLGEVSSSIRNTNSRVAKIERTLAAREIPADVESSAGGLP